MNKSNMKSTITQYAVAFLVFFSVLYFTMNKVFKSVSNASDAKIEKKIQELQKSIDIVQQKQNGMLDAIDNIETHSAYVSDAIMQNTERIDRYNKELANIKKQYGEKIRNADNYSTADLDSIFSSKYGKNQ